MGGPSEHDGAGLEFWMERVLVERARVREEFSEDGVHDLRTALRRTRTMAALLGELDAHGDWWLVGRQARRLFRRLGQLRDLHVLGGWAERLFAKEPDAAADFAGEVAARARAAERRAAKAVEGFKPRRWRRWRDHLAPRAERLVAHRDVFHSVALVRWEEARRLHDLAERTGDDAHYHELRIGVKRLRYVVENFLPELHTTWGATLKRVQDLLGDHHDLHVLGELVAEVRPDPADPVRVAWLRRLDEEKRRFLAWYRGETRGTDCGCWGRWRATLPAGPALEAAATAHVALWLGGHERLAADLRAEGLALPSDETAAAVAPPDPRLGDVVAVVRVLAEGQRQTRGRLAREFAEAFLKRGVETDQEAWWGELALAARLDRRRMHTAAREDLRHLRGREGKAIRALRLAAGEPEDAASARRKPGTPARATRRAPGGGVRATRPPAPPVAKAAPPDAAAGKAVAPAARPAAPRRKPAPAPPAAAAKPPRARPAARPPAKKPKPAPAPRRRGGS